MSLAQHPVDDSLSSGPRWPTEPAQSQSLHEYAQWPGPVMRVVIAEADDLIRGSLYALLNSEPGIRIVAECESKERILAALLTQKPDLVLINSQMISTLGFPGSNGVASAITPVVIPTTPISRSQDSKSSDAVLDQAGLQYFLQRTRSDVLSAREQLLGRVSASLAKLKTVGRFQDRLVIRTTGRIVFLSADEIDWVEAAANYVKFNAGGEIYTMRERIGCIAERLDPNNFVRVHRSIIINAGKIKELQPCNSGEYIVVLTCGKKLSCSRGYHHNLKRLMDQGL